jgi:hypothetical protein
MDPEIRYSVALAELRAAERNYADAETRLIQARRAVGVAEVGTKYHKLARWAANSSNARKEPDGHS